MGNMGARLLASIAAGRGMARQGFKVHPQRLAAFVLLGVLALAMAALAGCGGGDKFPNRPLTVIVPYGAGGDTDVLTRAMADYVTKDLGQPTVVKNSPGADATMGVAELKNANPDGYTVGGGDPLRPDHEPPRHERDLQAGGL